MRSSLFSSKSSRNNGHFRWLRNTRSDWTVSFFEMLFRLLNENLDFLFLVLIFVFVEHNRGVSLLLTSSLGTSWDVVFFFLEETFVCDKISFGRFDNLRVWAITGFLFLFDCTFSVCFEIEGPGKKHVIFCEINSF